MSAPTTPAEMADWLEAAAGLTESPLGGRWLLLPRR